MVPLRRHRRTISALLLALFVIAASGVPLSLRWGSLSTPGGVAERFPCENSPCGCATSDRCWRSCCCNTPAQRLAWAKREGVHPPEFALDEAEDLGLDVSPWRTHALVAKTFEAKPANVACRACCCKKPAEPAAEPAQQSTRLGVAIWKALACQGIDQHWLTMISIGPLPVQPTLVIVPPDLPQPARRPHLFDSRVSPPPVPPPEPSVLVNV